MTQEHTINVQVTSTTVLWKRAVLAFLTINRGTSQEELQRIFGTQREPNLDACIAGVLGPGLKAS